MVRGAAALFGEGEAAGRIRHMSWKPAASRASENFVMRHLASVLALLALNPLVQANQIVLPPVARQSITGSGPGWDHFGYDSVIVGYDSGLDIIWRGMVRFDLTALQPGSRVNSAVLRMTPFFALYADSEYFYLHRLTRTWTPGTTTGWNTPWSTPGGDFAPASASTLTPLGGQTIFQGLLVDRDVQGWIDSPASNDGYIVIEPNSWGEAHYGTIELVVDFDPPCPGPVSYCIAVPNSTGQPASIGSSGSARISDANFVLAAHGLPAGSPGLFFFGGQQQQTPWGNGFRCVAGQLYRIPPALFANAQGSVALPFDFTSPPGSIVTPGSTWNFQLYYRDSAAGGAGFNSTDGLHATFCH